MTFLAFGSLSVAATVAYLTPGENSQRTGACLSHLAVLVVLVAHGLARGFTSPGEVGLLAVWGSLELAELALGEAESMAQSRLKDLAFHAVRVTLVACVACAQIEYSSMGHIHGIGREVSTAALFSLVMVLTIILVTWRPDGFEFTTGILVMLFTVVCLAVYAALGRSAFDQGYLAWIFRTLSHFDNLGFLAIWFFIGMVPLIDWPPIQYFLAIGVAIAALGGNILLAAGGVVYVVISVPDDFPEAQRMRLTAIHVAVLCASTAVAIGTSDRLLEEVTSWLGYNGFPMADPFFTPLGSVSACGGLLGAGFGDDPVFNLPNPTVALGGVYDLGQCMNRMGVPGALGMGVPWLACAVAGGMSICRGEHTATAAYCVAVGSTQVLCLLACAGLVPALAVENIPFCAGPFQMSAAGLLAFLLARGKDVFLAMSGCAADDGTGADGIEAGGGAPEGGGFE